MANYCTIISKGGFKMSNKIKNQILICSILALGACATFSQNDNNQFIIKDAENFAKIIENGKIPDEKTLQTHYIDNGTEGIKIFTEGRIENAANLHKNIEKNFSQYQYAVKTCLPAARSIQSEAGIVLRKVADTLGEKDIAPAYILFGANNSGGHGDERGFSIGLEVMCRGNISYEEARKNLLGIIAHEIVHVYQARTPPKDPKYDILYVAIAEGGPDFIAQIATGNSLSTSSEYGKYGLVHEAEIWRDFKNDLEKGGNLNGNDWFYSQGRNGRPNDLGYFIGRRICEEYYKHAKDKNAALKEIISLQNPKKILDESEYGNEWNN